MGGEADAMSWLCARDDAVSLGGDVDPSSLEELRVSSGLGLSDVVSLLLCAAAYEAVCCASLKTSKASVGDERDAAAVPPMSEVTGSWKGGGTPDDVLVASDTKAAWESLLVGLVVASGDVSPLPLIAGDVATILGASAIAICVESTCGASGVSDCSMRVAGSSPKACDALISSGLFTIAVVPGADVTAVCPGVKTTVFDSSPSVSCSVDVAEFDCG